MKHIFSISLITCLLFGCNATDKNEFEEQYSYESKTPVKVSKICPRSITNKTVVLKDESLSLDKNDKGCYGDDSNPYCSLRIYQINVNSFNHSKNGAKGYSIGWGNSNYNGNIKGITESLEYINSLNVNTILLTPIFETKEIVGQNLLYSKTDSSGYYPSNYFKVDPKFGSLSDLKELVDKAHFYGMYVILDLPMGHAKKNVETVSPQGNKLVLSENCRTQGGTFEKVTMENYTCFDNKTSSNFFQELVRYWIKETKVDGFRLDQAYQLEPDDLKLIVNAIKDESAQPKNSYVMKLRNKQPLGFTVAEVWSEYPSSIDKNVFNGTNIDSAFDFPTRYSLVSVLATKEYSGENSCKQPVDILNKALNKLNSYTGGGVVTSFLDNHDVLRFGDLLQRAELETESLDPSYYESHQAVWSFIAHLSGPITLFYNDEIAANVPNFSKHVDACAMTDKCDDHVSRIQGKLKNFTVNEEMFQKDIKKLLNLRKNHKALYNGKRIHLYSDDSMFIDVKKYHSDIIMYILNTSSYDRKLEIKESTWSKLDFGRKCKLFKIYGPAILTSLKGDKITVPNLSGNYFRIQCH
ncbi:MAG: alpha-amylase family protein [Succinivibrionaceae bacterium]